MRLLGFLFIAHAISANTTMHAAAAAAAMTATFPPPPSTGAGVVAGGALGGVVGGALGGAFGVRTTLASFSVLPSTVIFAFGTSRIADMKLAGSIAESLCCVARVSLADVPAGKDTLTSTR